MGDQSEVTVWKVPLAPSTLKALMSEQGKVRADAYAYTLFNAAAKSAAAQFYKEDFEDQSKELGLEAAQLLAVALARVAIHPKSLPNYLKRIVKTMVRKQRELEKRTLGVEAEAWVLKDFPSPEDVLEPESPDSSDMAPAIRELLMEALKVCGASDCGLEIVLTVYDRNPQTQKEKTAVYAELASRHGLKHDRVRHIYFVTNRKIEANTEAIKERFMELLANRPRKDQLHVYKLLRRTLQGLLLDRG